MKKKNKLLLSIFSLFMGTILITSCSGSSSLSKLFVLDDLNKSGMKIGVPTGAASMYAAENYFENATIEYYQSVADGYTAVQTNKIDAFSFDAHSLAFAQQSNPSLMVMPNSSIGKVDIVVAMPLIDESVALKEACDEFIKYYTENGLYDDMYNRWYVVGSNEMPDIPESDSSEAPIIIGTEGLNQPANYFGPNQQLMGFDIEFAKRLGNFLDRKIEFKTADFMGLLSGLEAKKYDMMIANVNVTEERKDMFYFSDPYMTSDIGVVVNSGRGQESSRGPEYATIEELKDKRLGATSASTFDKYSQEYFPDASLSYYRDFVDLPLALTNNKIDGYLMDEPVARCTEARTSTVTYIREFIKQEQYAYCFKEGQQDTINELNTFIAKVKSDGTLKKLDEKWFSNDEDQYHIEDATNINGTKPLKVVWTQMEPFSFGDDVENPLGYDVELMSLFAKEYDYKLDFNFTSGESQIAQVQSEGDVLIGCITVTEEREEVMDFSDPVYEGGLVMCVRAKEGVYTSKYSTYNDLANSRVGALDDYSLDSLETVLKDKTFTPTTFSKIQEGAQSVINNDIDTLLVSDNLANGIICDNPSLIKMPTKLTSKNVSFAINNDDTLRTYIDSAIEDLRVDGYLNKLSEKYLGSNGVIEDDSSLAPRHLAPKSSIGTVKYLHADDAYPMAYVENGVSKGYEVDLMKEIASNIGATLDISSKSSAELFNGSDSYDVISGNLLSNGIESTTLSYSEPFLNTSIVGITDRRLSESTTTSTNFFEGIAESFRKTFIDEDRYIMIFDGIGVTLLISLGATLLGSLIGFGICMMRRSRIKFNRGFSITYIRLFQGLPLLVLLMILYYIVFAAADISGIVVSIFAFALMFGSYTCEMLRTGIEAVPKGQWEAAYALGFSKTRTFWKIIFPQAAKHFLPVFKGQFIQLVKDTSIVGYISVMDLTKVTDIIRSRTYEAFFPLITSAIIYFLLAYLLALGLDVVIHKVDPLKRKRVVKGVEQHD